MNPQIIKVSKYTRDTHKCSYIDIKTQRNKVRNELFQDEVVANISFKKIFCISL